MLFRIIVLLNLLWRDELMLLLDLYLAHELLSVDEMIMIVKVYTPNSRIAVVNFFQLHGALAFY